MKPQPTLVGLSLISILLLSLHLTDDILYANGGMGVRGLANLATVLILATWLYATIGLADHRSGKVLMLLGALLGAAMPVIHMTGTGGIVGADAAGSTRAFFFVWTTLAVGATSVVAGALAIRALVRGDAPAR